ncbi:aminoacyl-tRNA hydrolase [Cytobacillus sp. FJAT-54145]|uniref:peptidyl-tRNA hydrolase n=1 Tax=Cytobacillus spartinae TaxID=3299023 RepID=A0ABW6K5Y3_9BACI
MNDEIIQYYVVNKDLNMSVGKVAAQVAHGATLCTLDMVSSNGSRFPDYFHYFVDWYKTGMKKVVLRGTQKDLEVLKESGFYSIRDAGKTEIPEGSLTVVVLPPMPKLLSKRFVEQYSVY